MEQPARKTGQVTFPAVLNLNYSLVIEKKKNYKDTDIKQLWSLHYASTLPKYTLFGNTQEMPLVGGEIPVHSTPNHNAYLPMDIILELTDHIMSTW